ncbi:MAG: hypothetical protein ACTHJV_06985 [Rhizobiaceae bacterium]
MTYSPSRLSDLNRLRRAFWEFSAAAEPAFVARTERGNESSRWLPVGALPLVLVHYFSTRGVGVFVRGARGTRIGHVREFLFPHRRLLSERLTRDDIRLGGTFLLHDRLRCDMTKRENWPAAIAWLTAKSPLYEKALRSVQERGRSSVGPSLFT